MITVGLWCDECRLKYVRHRCKGERLPCGHPYWQAIWVQCQAFGRGGEHICLEWGPKGQSLREDVWVYHGERPRRDFVGEMAFEFWGMRVHRFHEVEPEWWVGEWLASKPDAVIRAYLQRWSSNKWMPDWLAFKEHPDARRSRALMRLDSARQTCGRGSQA